MKLSNTDMKLWEGLGTNMGRECDPTVIRQQIGGMTFLGVCGGKWAKIMDHSYSCGVILFLGESRALEVILDYDDTYKVRRNRLVTSGKDKGEIVIESETSGVYCDQLTEVVWSASCWK